MEENEIDLAALIGVLFRWKWLIPGLTIFLGGLALIASLLAIPRYEAISIVEVGQLQDDGEYNFVELPEAAAERLRGLSRRLSSQAPFNRLDDFSIKEDLNFQPSREGGILEIKLQAPKPSKAIEFLEALNKHLMLDHARIIDIERQKLKTLINNLESKIEEFQGKKSSYNQRLASLKEEREFLKKQIDATALQLDQILTIKAKANLQADNEPLGQLLFSNEMQRIQAHRDQLSTRLLSGIPKEREELINKIQEADSEIRTQKNNLEMNRVRLNNIISTNVLLSPQFSPDPSSPRIKMNVVLGLVAGLFLSICLAFILEFWRLNKEKIRGGGSL